MVDSNERRLILGGRACFRGVFEGSRRLDLSQAAANFCTRAQGCCLSEAERKRGAVAGGYYPGSNLTWILVKKAAPRAATSGSNAAGAGSSIAYLGLPAAWAFSARIRSRR